MCTCFSLYLGQGYFVLKGVSISVNRRLTIHTHHNKNIKNLNICVYYLHVYTLDLSIPNKKKNNSNIKKTTIKYNIIIVREEKQNTKTDIRKLICTKCIHHFNNFYIWKRCVYLWDKSRNIMCVCCRRLINPK